MISQGQLLEYGNDSPDLIMHPGCYVQITCGTSHNMAVAASGELFVWGENSSRQLGLDSVGNKPTKTDLIISLPPFAQSVKDVYGVLWPTIGQWGVFGDLPLELKILIIRFLDPQHFLNQNQLRILYNISCDKEQILACDTYHSITNRLRNK
eukprot:TRINITY_DN4617_c0_g1_i1.p1 TRINITY_DN4617_c0_g1~~TRINITY_DN4617_c0_g1_i1.p1  ORF type:complete len:152 (+),score=13.69 TRINITY_DN4617_c0_g1_i1:24-479(+)